MIAPSKGSVPGRETDFNEECAPDLYRRLPRPYGQDNIT